ncbi:MAG TPA: M1 family metallopeptidase, partial [Thermoanaerobaculia bacterium]
AYDPETRTITGTEHLRWRNDAAVPVPDLVFHHYLNAFANESSTFMRESGGQLRGVRFAEREWGWIEIDRFTLADGTDLKAVEEYVTETASGTNPDDRTVARYPLPAPVPPGGWIEMEIAFTARLPEIFARTGAHGDYVLAGQWYPKIAVFEEAGEGGATEPGWNAHPFHAHSEFFADFGDYDVTLTLPDRYRGKIGATGRRVEESATEATVTERYVQRGVHDFAWTAHPAFVVVRDRFDPAADVPAEQRSEIARVLGVDEAELALTPVDLELFVQPANARQAGRYLAAAKAGIRGYGLRLGAYPYETLTLVDPPLGGYGSAGMEYPTFITLGAHPLLAVPPFHRLMFPEIVTVHEFGHQYFQGMIASNEFEESWIDEGINSYYENVVMEEAFGPHTVRFLGLEVPLWESLRSGGLAGDGYSDPVVTPSWGFASGASYGGNSYSRPALVLRHLEGLLGPETFHRAMRAFFQRHRFTHPTTGDFERTFQEAAGVDLGWFFTQALHSTRALDYAVTMATSRRERRPRGVVWVDGERREPPRRGGEDADEDGTEAGDDEAAGDAGEDDGDQPYRSRVHVFRKGEFVHPVTVSFRFADGTVHEERWDGRARWARWTLRSPARLVSAEIDPDRRLALEENRLNNGWTVRPRYGAVAAFLTDVAFLVQALFFALGVLA